MVRNVLIKIKTRIYAAPAVKGLTVHNSHMFILYISSLVSPPLVLILSNKTCSITRISCIDLIFENTAIALATLLVYKFNFFKFCIFQSNIILVLLVTNTTISEKYMVVLTLSCCQILLEYRTFGA